MNYIIAFDDSVVYIFLNVLFFKRFFFQSLTLNSENRMKILFATKKILKHGDNKSIKLVKVK